MIKRATPDLPSPAPEGECKECGTPLAMGVHNDDCSHSGRAEVERLTAENERLKTWNKELREEVDSLAYLEHKP